MRLWDEYHGAGFAVMRALQRSLARSRQGLSIVALLTLPALPLLAATPESETATVVIPAPLQITVNSPEDGPAAADEQLTLREAIQIATGMRPLKALSEAERSQIAPLNNDLPARIIFELPLDRTTIRLQSLLPPLTRPGLTIDGTTQPGYQKLASTDLELTPELLPEDAVPLPVVTLTPARDREVFRGLTIVADNITIRGLSLYGFTSRHRATASMPPGNIFIAHHLLPDKQRGVAAYESPFPNPPQGIEITQNWLGSPPIPGIWNPETNVDLDDIVEDDDAPLGNTPRSAFGIYAFNTLGTTIHRNHIVNHSGSGIITAKNTENLHITENIIARNGFGGMPDAIRLEGNIRNAQIRANLIRENAGSSLYFFKPTGAALIEDNLIANNGKRYRRAAVFLMGNDHQVANNRIIGQPGPGVAVTGYPSSDRNLIQGNQFAQIDGLSIDLVTEQDTNVLSFQIADGANPETNSFQRQRKTANFGIDAPRFVSREFFLNPRTNSVTLLGSAEPNARLEIYRVDESGSQRGPLSQPLLTAEADGDGQFSVVLDALDSGTVLSATATHPSYGTSEPSLNVKIRSIIPTGARSELPH